MSKDFVESEFEDYEAEPEAGPEVAEPIRLEIDEQQISDWLSWLSDGVPGLFEVGIARADGPFSRQRFAAVQDVIDFAIEKAAYANVHPAMTTRVDDSSGERSNVHSTRVLWAELDPPKFDEKGDALRLSIDQIEQFKEKALSLISTFEPKPTAVLDSGNGIHAIWGLDEVLDLRAEEQKQAIEQTLIGLAKALGPEADLAVAECARVMRCPGTINIPNAKKRALGRVMMPCLVLQWDRNRSYSFNEFASFRDRGRDLWRKRRRSRINMEDIKSGWNGGVPADVVALLDAVDEKGNPEHPDLVLRWHGNTAGLKDRSGSGVDQSIANHLIALGVDPQDVARALMARSAARGDEAKGDSYYSHTITKAVSWCEDPLRAGPSAEADAADGDESDGATRYAVADGSDESYAVVFRDSVGLGDRWLYMKSGKIWLFWDGTVFTPGEAGVRSELWRLEEPLRERARVAEERVAEYEAELEKLGGEDGPPNETGDSSDPEDPEPVGETGYHKALRSSVAKHRKVADTWRSMARGIRDEGRRSSVAKTLEGMLRVEADDLDANRDLLTFPASSDGRWPAVTVELDSLVKASDGGFDPGKVQWHKPTPVDRITMHMGCPWVPGARNSESENVIRQILPDDELRATALQEIALAMGGRREVQRATFFYGPGGTGKSTLLQHFLDTFGSHAVKSTPAILLDEGKRRNANEHTSALEAVRNKRLVAVAEFTATDQLGSRFKELTGEKTASSREAYASRTNEIELKMRFVMLSNYLVKVDPTDEGIWRRLVPIPCNERFVDATRLEEGQELAEGVQPVDRSVDSLMRSEDALAATAQLIMAELALYMRSGETRPLPQGSREELNRLREESNPLGVFVEENLEVEPGVFTPTSEIAERYRTFAATRHQKPIADNQIAPLIIECLKAHSVRMDRGTTPDGRRARGIFGVKLRTAGHHGTSDEFDG